MDWNETIPALIKALNNHTAALNGFVAATGKAPAAAAAGKPAAEKAAEKPAASKPAASAKKAPTAADIAKHFGEYLGVKDAAEREVRKANVKAIVDYFGAPKATEIPAESFAEALGYLQNYIDGETPSFAAADDAGDEGESLV